MARLVAKNDAVTTLAAAAAADALTITVATGTGALFGAAGDWMMRLGTSRTAGEFEYVRATAITGDVITVTRAQAGTTAIAHAKNTKVWSVIDATVYDEIWAAIDLCFLVSNLDNTAGGTDAATTKAPTSNVLYDLARDVLAYDASPQLRADLDLNSHDITSAAAVAFKVSGDTDNYISFSTASNVPSLTAVGALNIASSGAIGLKPSGDLTALITFTTVSTSPTITVTGILEVLASGVISLKPDGDTDNYIEFTTSANVPYLKTDASMGITAGTTVIVSPMLQVGTEATNSVDPGIFIARSLTTGVTNAHGFSDSTHWARGGDLGYGSFDARIEVSGTIDIDHYVGFQFSPTINFTGTMDSLFGFSSYITHSGGTITDFPHLRIKDPTGSGVITTQYGLKIQTLTRAATNYAIYVEGGDSYFAGPIKMADDVAVTFGGVASLLWETADANANALFLVLPTGGSVDVPAFVIGDESMLNKDLTWLNGRAQPLIALVAADESYYMRMDYAGITTSAGAYVFTTDITVASTYSIRTPNTDDNYFTIEARDNTVGLVEVLRVQASADPYVRIGRDDTGVATNAVTDGLVLQMACGTNNSAAGQGFGISVMLGNAASETQERASIDFTLATPTDGAEDVNMVISLMSSGTMATVVTFYGDDLSATFAGEIVATNFGWADGVLTAGLANAFGFYWQNPHAYAIIVYEVWVDVTTAGGTATSVMDVGSAANASTHSDDLLQLIDLNAVQFYVSSGAVKLDANGGATDYITGQILVANASGLVGKWYIKYRAV